MELTIYLFKLPADLALASSLCWDAVVEPSIEQIAPAVARSMAHASTVVRNTSAKAVHALLGAAPGAMALCTRRTAAADSEVRPSVHVVVVYTTLSELTLSFLFGASCLAGTHYL